MHKHEAHIRWLREGVEFADQRYSRVHEWDFDGGATVIASASPSIVPEPYSDPSAVDPEEALVAAASSCHMLWFLSLAAKGGFVVDRYEDNAYGVLEKDGAGRLAFNRITLRPEITFSGEQLPSEEELSELHRGAHNSCFIANSLSCEVIVAAA